MSAQVIPIRAEAESLSVEHEVVIIPRLLSLGEAAELLGKTESQLRWMIHRKTAPKSRLIGGRRMFRAKDIAAYVDEIFEESEGAAS